MFFWTQCRYVYNGTLIILALVWRKSIFDEDMQENDIYTELSLLNYEKNQAEHYCNLCKEAQNCVTIWVIRGTTNVILILVMDQMDLRKS